MNIYKERITALRKLMAERGLGGYIIPSGDAHAGEYVAAFWRGREWISGFTGSAGLVVILPDEAGLWTDGRYFLQAERELEGSEITLFKQDEQNVPKYTDFLADKLPHGATCGFDGRVVTATEFKRIKDAFAAKDKEISFAYSNDLLGMIWHDRPSLPTEKIFAHEATFAGATSAEKLADVRVKMKESGITAYLICALDSIAWLLNIRGGDVACLPVAYAYALVMEETAHVFIDCTKLAGVVLDEAFEIHDYDAIADFLKNIQTKKLYYNANTTNVLLAEAVDKNISAHEVLKPAEEILPLLKAIKSECELENIRDAFLHEGVAMVKLLHWLNAAVHTIKLTDGSTDGCFTEGDIVRALQNFRRENPHYICDSFPTISAYGANAAVVHYNSGETGAHLYAEGFLLIDTGGQYLNGTTDTTRTVCLGEISDEMRRDFTLVLKGNIALSQAVFIKGTTGTQLDILARQALWQNGQNYLHGTGHGLGYCLSVHEGPHNIAQPHNAVELAPGMLVSNEPGAYKKDRYGIRTENILAVRERETTPDGTFLEFEVLTCCPMDTRAIDMELLTQNERDWLSAYHARVRELLSPLLSEDVRKWLHKVTQ